MNFRISREDEKLLKWMCDRSLEGSKLDEAELAMVRTEKHQSVDEVARLTRDSKRCFRKSICAAFGDKDRTTRTILDLAA